MRTLQEKYNAIQEGKFSKENFLADARKELPNLVTRFNGYDDAVQILKNRGMIVEAKKEDGKKVTDHPFIVYTDKQGKHHIEEKNYEDDQKDFFKTIPDTWDVYETRKEAAAEKQRRDREGKKETVNEARLTKNNLTDYRYKPTNEMDKYPYEQILRGLRVELETMGVQGTPTAEEYAKALAKVSKNLEKDSIFYTNQVAGVNPKVDQHDQMTPATAKNTVDTFNGMKKAALKEGFKKLIKKVLSESDFNDPDLYDSDEERDERRWNYNDHGDFGPETEFGDEPEDYKQEDEMFEMYGEDSMDESAMGDIYQIAQEHDRFEHFVQAVEDEFGPVDDIAELEHIFNATRDEDDINYGDENFSDAEIDTEYEGDPGYQGYESPSDRAMKSDAWVQAQRDMMETRKAKSLSELLK